MFERACVCVVLPSSAASFLPDADDDYAIHTHGNGICVLTLAPTHPLRRLNKTITSGEPAAAAAAPNMWRRSRGNEAGGRLPAPLNPEANSPIPIGIRLLRCGSASHFGIHLAVVCAAAAGCCVVAWQGVSSRAMQAQDRSKAKVSGKRKKGGQ